MNLIRKPWRDASSLIMLAKNKNYNPTKVKTNFDILMQTRPKKGTFASASVFPGGVNEIEDESDKWFELLNSFGYDQDHMNALHNGNALPFIFQNNPIKRHVSLRITAIRETFEELGVLLCSNESKQDRNHKNNNVWIDTVQFKDISDWQKKVSEDPKNFLEMCIQNECYPDIWSLHYWSNWLTPALYNKRFNTAFFVTAFDKRPSIESSNEVVHIEWSSPLEVLEKFKTRSTILPPPQFYELLRLCEFTDIESLAKFAKNRSSRGGELFYPVNIKAKDAFISLLPGDDLYPSEVNFEVGAIERNDTTKSELAEKCNVLHRFVTKDKDTELTFKNYEPDHVKMSENVYKIPALLQVK